MRRNIYPLVIAASLVACSESKLDCVVEGYESCNLKGNVEEVISITYSASAERDCEPVECSNAWDAGYWQFDENGHCTKATTWDVPYENCKESSFVAWNADGNPLEYIHWDMDQLSTKISHLKYTYDFNGILTDTHDERYSWALKRRSEPVSTQDMKNDMTGYQYVISLGDTIGAVKFSEVAGVSEFIHFAHRNGNKYELKYFVKCVESRRTIYTDGKETKTTYKDGSTKAFEYDGMQLTNIEYKSKQSSTITEFKNGYATTARTYDSGNNIISTTEYSFRGNIRRDGSYKATTRDQSGKVTTEEYFYKNGEVVKEVVHRDSTTTSFITYNDNGDVLCVDAGKGNKWLYRYEYDDKRNWVVRRIFDEEDKPLSITERIIKYRN